MVLGKSAAAQALVYLYEFESAMYWLLISVIDFISIEMDNDVVSQLKNRVLFSKYMSRAKVLRLVVMSFLIPVLIC